MALNGLFCADVPLRNYSSNAHDWHVLCKSNVVAWRLSVGVNVLLSRRAGLMLIACTFPRAVHNCHLRCRWSKHSVVFILLELSVTMKCVLLAILNSS